MPPYDRKYVYVKFGDKVIISILYTQFFSPENKFEQFLDIDSYEVFHKQIVHSLTYDLVCAERVMIWFVAICDLL